MHIGNATTLHKSSNIHIIDYEELTKWPYVESNFV